MGAGCCGDGGSSSGMLAAAKAKKAAVNKEEKARAKETMKIAKFCRFNTPSKKCKIRKEEYDYFTAHDAIDTLFKSKYCEKDGHLIPRSERQEGKLYTRSDCTTFFKHLVFEKFVGRCVKKYKDGDEPTESEKNNSNTEEDKKKSSKKKFKIMGHPHQGFFDDEDEVYIWVWNPTPPMHYVYGIGVLLVVIGGTLFPLWPQSLRTGVYYTSVSGAGFIGSVLVVGFLRTILFGIIWGMTRGKHHFWFLPNLLADVGFFESFVPVYTYDVFDDEGNKIKKKKIKKAIEGEQVGDENKKDQ